MVNIILRQSLRGYRVLAQEQFLEVSDLPLPGPRSLAGHRIRVYTIVSQIGQGGMSSVWLAECNDGRFERRVAVKFLNIAFAGSDGERRFRREGKILGRLTHPYIAELVDAGVSPARQPYLVLEHVEGEHIDRYCDQHTFDVRARARLFLNVLAAVAHAHSNLIVHRDIKPSNVLVRNDGQVKLLDFGISKLLEGEGETGKTTLLTAPSGPAMTPAYAAPEQLRDGMITTGTDIYSLGVLLYILMTGQHPVGAGPYSPADLVKAIVDIEPARPSEIVAPTYASADVAVTNAAKRAATPDKLRRSLCGDLDTIIAKTLKKNQAERYASVAALADDLGRYLRNEPINARRDTVTYRATKFVRRHRAAVAFTTLGIIVVIASLIGALIQARMARAQRDIAFRQILRAEVVNEFDSFLLSDAAPSGKPLTVNELLGRAERIVARQHGADPANQVGLMVSIGHQYLMQDQAGSARRLLEEAYKRSRGLSDLSVRARASCALAPSLARDEELSRAETLFREGIRELPEKPQFVFERIDCLQSGSEVAEQRGDIREAIARAETAQRVLRQSPFDYDVLELCELPKVLLQKLL
jgi:eukaryotic-like serine/threonine-protein kinase